MELDAILCIQGSKGGGETNLEDGVSRGDGTAGQHGGERELHDGRPKTEPTTITETMDWIVEGWDEKLILFFRQQDPGSKILWEIGGLYIFISNIAGRRLCLVCTSYTLPSSRPTLEPPPLLSLSQDQETITLT